MITLHRLGQPAKDFNLNHDMIVTVEANPDTVIALTTGAKIVVAEPPEAVARKVRDCRIEILTGAMRRRHEERAAPTASSARGAANAKLTVLEPPAVQLGGQPGQS